MLTCFERLRSLGGAFTVPLYKAMFEKLTEVSTRPALAGPELAEDDQPAGEAGLKVGRKV